MTSSPIRVVDRHDIHAPGFPGGVLRYEVGRDAAGRHYWRRPEHRAWSGPVDTYDAAVDAIAAIESAGACRDRVRGSTPHTAFLFQED